jgi:hypothetical protein
MHAGFSTTSGSNTPRWRIVNARELTPEEKGDKHHVYVQLRDQAGQDARGTTSVKSGWEGMDQPPIITPTDKQPPDPATNIPIFEDQKLWVEVDAGTAASDRASGMDCFHAYEVVFQYDDGISQLPNPAAHLRTEPAHEPTRNLPETNTLITDTTAWTPPITFLRPEPPDPCEDLLAPDLLPESESDNA